MDHKTYSFEIFQDDVRPPLALVQPEVDPYNTPTPKTTLVPNMWISTGCGDMAI